MKCLMFAVFLSIPFIAPATAHAMTPAELLQETSALVDRLNAGELADADATIESLSMQLVAERAQATVGSLEFDTLELVEADLNGAREFLTSASAV